MRRQGQGDFGGEKFRPSVAERVGHDPFGGRFLGCSGADAGVEVEPNNPAKVKGQVMEQSLSDQAQLDAAFIGCQLAANGLAVTLRLAGRRVLPKITRR